MYGYTGPVDVHFASDKVSSAQNRADVIAYLEKATKYTTR